MLSIPAATSARSALLAACALSLVACGGGGSSDNNTAFVVSTAQYGVAGDTPVVVDGIWLAFLADEASSGATDLNWDGQVVDQVAVAVNLSSKVATNIGVAALALAWLDGSLFLVVDEAFDDRNWGGAAAADELVLLRWNADAGVTVFVSTLDRASVPAIVAAGDTLFFASATTPGLPYESSLFAIDADTPEEERPVFTRDDGGALSPRLIGEQEGLVLLALDETTEGRSLNGDADTTDVVLALLDGTGEALPNGYDRDVRSTGLAISGVDSPWRASFTGAGDWLVGFLVDEDSQDQTNLNLFDGNTLPATWKASGCGAGNDADTDDRVLHVIEFAAWDLDPLASPPINTGIVGTDRVLISGNRVGTISLEADEGNCTSLNGDGDRDDRVLRWFRNDVDGPVTSTSVLLALDTALPGPAKAVGELDGIFVIQCDEAADGRDHDGEAGSDRDLVAWLDPQEASPSWTFDHGLGGTSWATATWMGELPARTRLGVAYAEAANDDDINNDGDTADSIPTFVDLRTTPTRRLAFEGPRYAVVPDNAGISLATGYGFYRVDEAQHGSDLNGNATTTDILILRSNLTTGESVLMGALNTLPRPAMESEPDGISYGGVFLFDETISGTDLSGDLDAQDLVVRYFTFE